MHYNHAQHASGFCDPSGHPPFPWKTIITCAAHLTRSQIKLPARTFLLVATQALAAQPRQHCQTISRTHAHSLKIRCKFSKWLERTSRAFSLSSKLRSLRWSPSSFCLCAETMAVTSSSSAARSASFPLIISSSCRKMLSYFLWQLVGITAYIGQQLASFSCLLLLLCNFSLALFNSAIAFFLQS